MKCSRSWQIEAARDGRLTGKDLVNALRHRERCADCAREHFELARLGSTLQRLPLLARDPLTTHRQRQQLLAGMNAAVLAPSRTRTGWRASAGLLTVLAVLAVLAVAGGRLHERRKTAASDVPRSVVEVHAQPGSLWTEHVDAETDRIDLTEGIASFRVHPHQRRTVVVRLPDGEIQDVGTVFEVNVHDHQTRSITLQEGRVFVRLHDITEFTLSAGQAWRRPESVPSASPGAGGSGATRTAVLPNHEPHAKNVRAATSALAGQPAAKPQRNAPADSSQAHASRSEDRAYLAIVTLLDQHKYAEAQSAAKQYLLEFPNGFRRVEVLNVATRGANDDHANGD